MQVTGICGDGAARSVMSPGSWVTTGYLRNCGSDDECIDRQLTPGSGEQLAGDSCHPCATWLWAGEY